MEHEFRPHSHLRCHDAGLAQRSFGGAVSRFGFSKTFHGDLQGAAAGVMLPGGDPQAAAVGYVAIKTAWGQLSGRLGSFAPRQFGSMRSGSQTLHYEVIPGSGSGQLAGISRVFHLNLDEDGTHRYKLEYEL